MLSSRILRSTALVASLALTVAGADAAHAQKTDGASASAERGLYTAPNGDVFSFVKHLGGAEDKVVYTRDGVTYDAASLKRYQAENPPPTIEPELREAIARAGDETMDVIVWLKNRPGTAIARQVQAIYADELETMGAEVRAVHNRLRLPMSLSPEEEANYIDFAQRGYLRLTAEQQQFVEARKLAIDDLKAAMQTEVRRQTERAIAADQRQLAAQVDGLGGTVKAVIVSQNATQVTLSARQIARLAELPEIAGISAVPFGQLDLDKQDNSLGLNGGFWDNNIDGGVWDVGILDTGIEQGHPKLDHVTYESTHGTTDTDGHGTGVAGIIYSDHSDYRGMAYSLDNVLVGDCQNGNIYHHADWMVGARQDDPEAINLSCGYGTANGSDYASMDKFFDALIDDHRVFVGKSAGNNGDGTTTISIPASAYNLISVANVDDKNSKSRGNHSLRSTSSRGPTLHGRKKPDLAAPGHNTKSARKNYASGDNWTNIGGTSAAAPHVTGGAILVTDLRGNDDPKATKAVLINTADAWNDGGEVNGSEWNKDYGWGYLDLGKAWLNGTDVFVDAVDDGSNRYKLYRGTMYAHEKATVTWHRHSTYNGTSTPTNILDLTDLDLYVYSATSGVPIDSSTSRIDNVEQVAVSANGDMVIKVDLYGSLDSGLSSQSYALATEENFQKVDPPSLSLSASNVTVNTSLFDPVPVGPWITVHNTGGAPAQNITATATISGDWSLLTNINRMASIDGGASFPTAFYAMTDCKSAGESQTVTVTVTSDSYGETLTATTSYTITCG
ncbi:MAG: S8 family serine peptidase [Acidobacteriota bacterium]